MKLPLNPSFTPSEVPTTLLYSIYRFFFNDQTFDVIARTNDKDWSQLSNLKRTECSVVWGIISEKGPRFGSLFYYDFIMWD